MKIENALLDSLIEQENRLYLTFSGEDVDSPTPGYSDSESDESFSQAPQEG